ncbi:fusaric acid resistance protein [Cupriavidus necator]|uniref:Fusaric acid resistance protein n=1 Tax=Cupriavidus necator TaxID=106590 RepID=A0A1U9UPA0_CUPNE|nr:FUSC family protein [Cupriavidus necator]AQV94409.1 fusaric acid resistance protein [Cupriavidus necator]
MAQPAADKLRLGLADILALLAPLPGRAAATTRITVACTLTVLVTSIYGTPEAAISAYVIFFINRADRTSSIVMSVAALVLVSLVIGLVIWLADFSVDDPLRRVACMAVVSAAVLFLTSASKLRPIGGIVAMIIGFALDELGLVPSGEIATRALLYAWLMVAIPLGVNVVVNLVLGPAPRRLATDRLAHCLRLAARSLQAPDGDPDALHEALRDGVQPIAGWLKLAKIEGSVDVQDLLALRQAAASTMAILMAADVARRQPGAQLPATITAPIAATLDDMARMLDAGGYPVEIGLGVAGLEALSPVQQGVAAELAGAINRYAEPDEADERAPQAQAGKAHGGFLDADAFSNPVHVRYALKTTGAAMFCYFLYQQLNWPGIHTCFITCYLVSLGTAAETVEKLSLRLAGCLVGAVLGTAAIVYVVPSLTSVGGLLLLVFAGTWISAWVAQGSPRIAYAGFQVAFAFYLCVIQGAGPGFDLTVARDRVIGILLGNLVVYLVFTRIWPVSIASRIEAALAALVAQWQQLATARQPDARRGHAATAIALHGEITQDLILANYEPASVGPARDWIDDRRQRLDVLDAIAGPMFLLAERFPGDPEVARRLHALQATGAVPPPAHAADGPHDSEADKVRQALLAIVDRRLTETPVAAPGATSPTSVHAQT